MNDKSNLTDLIGDNKYCGPAALATICHLTTDEAEKVCQSVVGTTKPIKGLYPSDLRAAFRSLGYHTTTVNLPRGTSLFSAMFRMGQNHGMFVFEIPEHYIVIEITPGERYICDNHTRKPINMSASARLNQKVMSVFKVSKQND